MSDLLNRRQIAMGAAIGSASLLFSSAAMAQTAAGEGTFLDARQSGARGDGKTNDTVPLQRALDAAGRNSGALFLPPGIYVTGELHVPPGVAIVGTPGWNYSSPGGSVLQLADAGATCLLNLTDARGASLQGLSLDGRGLGSSINGIATKRAKWGPHEDGFRIEGCQIARFSGDGVHLECAWCFSVRHSMMAYNAGDGLSLRGWDGFLIDNWFSGNKRAGFAARQENASVTFTANRIEWNGEENFVIAGGDGYQITGNFFDRAGTVGVALRKGRGPCTQIALTGNFIKRSGKLADPSSHDSANILLDECEGITCIGNTLQAGRDDGGSGVWSPAYGIVHRGLRNCIVKDNVLHDGAIKQLILETGAATEGVIVADNPGRLFTDFARKW
ncbi:MAG TPA: right-handed parallel beta-helix repeat-containing protein [Terracidiphilus sp.]